MNGEFQELFNKVDKRISVFEGVMEERWKHHATRADALTENMLRVFDKIESLPCSDHEAKINTNIEKLMVSKEDFKTISTRINIMLFAVLGSFIITVIVLGFKAVYAMAGGV